MTMEQFHAFLRDNPAERAELVDRLTGWVLHHAEAEEAVRAVIFLRERFVQVLEGGARDEDEQRFFAYITGHMESAFYGRQII